MEFYKEGRSDGGSFDDGIEAALQRVLADPEFVYRAEPEPAGLVAGKSYRITDLALASRLSFFLWSSVPDDELIDLAAQGKLKDPAVLEKQVRRMLADPKSQALITNFTGQWLGVRSLADQRAGGESVSGFRRQPAGGLPARDRTVLRQHCFTKIAASWIC